MKTLTFTVEVEDTKISDSFIDGIIDEVSDEKKQYEITKKINKATTKLHRDILIDLIAELNIQLKKVDLYFESVRTDSMIVSGTNSYTPSITKMVVNKRSYVLMIDGQNELRYEHSKYTTYTGKYNLKLGLNNSAHYTARQAEELSNVKDVNAILEVMKFHIKEHVSLNIVSV